MPAIEDLTPGQVLADASVAEFIKQLGLGIAEAQTALDRNSVSQMDAFTRAEEGLGDRSLLELGLLPAFYHYEHADISVSLQIRLEVGTTDEFGFGVDARFGHDRRSSGSSQEGSREEESESREETLTAQLQYRADSEGVVVVNGTQVTPTGGDPFARLRDLRQRLTSGDEIDALFLDPPETSLDISTDAPANRVVVTDRSVAFQRDLNHRGFISIRENQDTEFVLNDDVTVATTAQADLSAYAQHVNDQIRGVEGFDTYYFPPPGPERERIWSIRFANDDDQVSDEEAQQAVERFGRIVARIGAQVTLEGMTDRTGRPSYNVDLGNRRARNVRRLLVDNGVDPDNIQVIPSRGEGRAQEAGVAPDAAHDDWRAVWINTPGRTSHWIAVRGAREPLAVLADVSPDIRSTPDAGNGFVYLWSPANESLAGLQVTIEGREFGLSGAAGGGHQGGTPEAHAHNLATAINATDSLRASRLANVVHVMRATDEYTVRLYGRSGREISLTGSEGMRVTEEFSRLRTSQVESQEGKTTTVAVGVTVNHRETRQFNMTVTGNSQISARLVSVPPPEEFKTAIQLLQAERRR